MTEGRLTKLYGTSKPAGSVQTYSAGALSIEIEGGAVRYVRFNGHEAIRGIDFLVRDRSWGTPPARLSPVSEQFDETGFSVVFDGEVDRDGIHFRYRITVTGTETGDLEVVSEGEALSSFSTNRLGFVVLHPIVGVAGSSVIVTRKDGTQDETIFPEIISPGQPIFDIRALTHEVCAGLFVTCRMEASLPRDAETIFEMEDQRNWTDASYKTYVGSLLDPWPFQINKGDQIRQRIALSFNGAAAPKLDDAGGETVVRIGQQSGDRVPAIGLGLMSKYREELASSDHPAMLLRPQAITVYVEQDDPDIDEIVADYGAIGSALGCDAQLELVLPGDASPKTELDAAAQACERAELAPDLVIALPRLYLKSTQPSGPWPEVCDLGHIYNMTRAAFPNAAILGGMLSDFTELNRKRPPAATLDGITCTTTAILHAPDDRSVLETLETLPFTVTSMVAMAGGKKIHIGPCSIAMRHNPHGAAPVSNPDMDRIAMVEKDPRQSGLFAAVWTLGYAAAIAATGKVESLILNQLAGPMGVVGHDGGIWPVYHVMAALSRAGGKTLISVDVKSDSFAALAYEYDGTTHLILSNLKPEPQSVQLSADVTGIILDCVSMDAAASDPDWSTQDGLPLGRSIELDGFATLFATLAQGAGTP